MSDKAERVAKLIWDGVYGNGPVPPIVAAILREEYPEAPTLDQLAKSQGVEPIEDMGTLVIPGLEDDPPIDPAPDVSALREELSAVKAELAGVQALYDEACNVIGKRMIADASVPDVSALREALVLLNRLLCRVNAVTAFHRHKQAIPKSRLDALAETQFEVEEKRSALLRSEPKLGGTV